MCFNVKSAPNASTRVHPCGSAAQEEEWKNGRTVACARPVSLTTIFSAAATGSTPSERWGTVALLAAGISAAGIALLALFGWVLGASALTAWGAGIIPMAPSTAVLSVLISAALALCAPMPPRSSALRLATLIGWVGAVSALVLFLLRLRGEYWPVEHLGFRISGAFRGAAVGYISPVTAFCFLLANGTLLTLLSPGAHGSWRRWLAWSVGGLISVTGFVLLLAHAFGAPLLFRDASIPPAFNTSLILLIVGLALLVLAGRLRREARVSPEGAPRSRPVFLVIFVAFAALTITGGYGYYRQEEQELRGEAERQLDVVAKLKASGLSQWRKERLGDATVMLRSAVLSASFEHFLQRPGDTATVGQLQEWLGSYQAYGQYDRAFLIDAHGATRFSLPAEPPSAAISRQASEVLRTGQVALQDFYLDERDQRVHLAILAPILDQSSARRPIGVLVLRIDPESFLYPFIASWPTTSPTAEALLVRRDGPDVLYLSNLRFDPNAALRRRIPLENARVLAVKAALGQTGAVDGLDYRGVAVLGALHPIPDSPWYLVTRIDIAEFSAQLWNRVWLIAALTIVLLSGEGLGLGLIWRNQRTGFYRKQAELGAALQESEERLRLALSAADQGLYDLNVQTGEVVVSPEYATMLGYDPAEFHETNAAWIERMHPDDRGPVVAAFKDYLAGRRDEYCVEFRQRAKSGDWKWILSLGKVVSRAADGQPLRMLGTRTNITARKVAEIRSRRLAQLYAALSQCDQAIVRCTNEAELFPQVCRDTVVFGGMTMAWIGLVDEASQQIRPVASYGEGVEYLEGLRLSMDVHDPLGRGPAGTATRDNQPVWCQDYLHDPRTAPWLERAERFGWAAAAALPLRRHGRPIGALTLYSSTAGAFDEDIRALLMEMATDISFALDNFARQAAHRQAEEALRESEERFRSFIENASDIVLGLTPGGIFTYVSPNWLDLMGEPAAAAVGRSFEHYVHPDDVHLCREFLAPVLDTEEPLVSVDYRALHRDGSIRWHSTKGSALRDRDGHVVGYVGIARDVTEQKRLQEQFLQSQKMEVVGRLAGGIAHDFNNLLTVINGTADLALLDLPADNPLRPAFEHIQQAGDRAVLLTRQLLAFSRKQILAPVMLNVSELVAGMSNMLLRLIEEDIDLVINAAQPLDSVLVDPGQLDQVLLNLAVNARDAMPTGGSLTIETCNVTLDDAFAAEHPGSSPGPHVMLAVTDTGVGMTAEVRDRIFEPFFTTKEPGKGTGLGLATAYGIVKQSGGSILVESEPGRGACFKVFLPSVAATVPGGPAARAASPLRGTETILVVEDERALRELATRMLRSAGYNVLAADSGSDALAMVQSHNGAVHLVVTDVVMPGMSGSDLASALELARPGIKVIFTSGYADDAILRHGVLTHTSHFMPKPYTVAQLKRKVRDVLDLPPTPA